MKQRLLDLVKENTIKEKYKRNNAMDLGVQLGLSRNWISQYLNEFYNDQTFIKINTRPVVFLDKKEIEKSYQVELDTNLFSSFQEMFDKLKGYRKKDFQKLIGYHDSLSELVDKCKASIAYPPNGLPTLLHGPTGSGKSFIASLMYEYGVNRKYIEENKQFIHVNCSEYANNPELLTANLFGYKKGAFTGADSDNAGLLKVADGGMLFLDEVHCLKPECQEKLFLFMDSGSYRMLGDNENLYHSHVRLVFATTEDPQKVLLKTLYRRIPIRLSVPSIEERGMNEKTALILSFLKQEGRKIKQEIRISNIAYNILMNAKYSGNVGEIKNVVQATCMNALYHQRDSEFVDINLMDLSESVIANANMDQSINFMDRQQMIALKDMEHVHGRILQNTLLSALLENMLKLQNNQMGMSEFLTRCMEDIDDYYAVLLFDKTSNDSVRDRFVLNMMKKIIEMIALKYGMEFHSDEIQGLSLLINDFARHKMGIMDFYEQNKDQCQDFAKIINKKYAREYSIAQEAAYNINVAIDLKMNDMLVSLLVLSMVKYHAGRDVNKRISVILAHGYATASSIANAANLLLDQYVFDAIDMPLDSSTEVIISKLNEYLDKRGDYQDLVLLVDMGSLESIYEGMTHKANANIAIANNVNTKMALSVGKGLSNGLSLKEIFTQYRNENQDYFHVIEKKEKEKVILCSCATGIGTAEKLKAILVESLPKALPVQVLTYDYSTLLEHKLESDFFKNYEVICIVGTLNPNIAQTKFIPIEELITSDSFDILTVHFKDLIDEQDMIEFRKKILKNFSLSNIIGTLTFLNPDKLLEHVADAIDRLQKEMNRVFSYNMCFGLYVHICCLIERLVCKEGAEEYVKRKEECDKELQEFILYLKNAFTKVEKYYHIDIPIEEIEYIKIYINNM